MFEIDEQNLPFVRTRQALIVIDLQNDFCTPSGALPVLEPSGYLDRTVKLTQVFRTSGRVIWIRSCFEASRPINQLRGVSESVVTDKELLPTLEKIEEDSRTGSNEPIKQTALEEDSEDLDEKDGQNEAGEEDEDKVAPLEVDDGPEEEEETVEETFLTLLPGQKAKVLLRSSPGSNFAKEAIQQMNGQTDLIFQKTWYSAFKDGSLVQTLRANFVTEIFICGVLTNISIFATAMDAARYGYAITIVEDCLGYRNKAKHDEALRRLKEFTGCDVTSSQNVIDEVEERARKYKAAPPRKSQRPQTRQHGLDLETLMARMKLVSEESSPAQRDQNATGQAENVTATEAADEHATSLDDSNESYELKLPARSSESNGKRPERVRSKIKTRRRHSKPEIDGHSANTATDKSASTDTSQPQTTPPQSIDTNYNTTSKNIEVKPATNPPEGPHSATMAGSKSGYQKDIPTPHAHGLAKNSKALPRDDLEALCEGDTSVVTNLLDDELADGIFEKVRDEVKWQKMSHMGGDVPRLVCVQGHIAEDGSFPIYRHPADEMPPLSPFSPVVARIAAKVEDNLGHPVNNVLIQWYRDSTDHITEHSDKTLDIVPGTFIANVSLGAQRTMVLRTKKSPMEPKESIESNESKEPEAREPELGEPRRVCRAPLPHNSMFKMGLATNMRWLHGIRPDKRLKAEKTLEELAYDCGRISLTFRQIGTFLDKDQEKIWGQGATSKTRENAQSVINGDCPEAVNMIRAFGTENHLSEFDWKAVYGGGFDVLHRSARPKLFLSGDFIADTRVKVMLAELGIAWTEEQLSTPPTLKSEDTGKDEQLNPDKVAVKFVDNDPGRSTVSGDIAILLYLDAVYGSKLRATAASQPDLAKQFTRLQLCETLLAKWHTVPFSVKPFRREMDMWASLAAESRFIAGPELSIADFAFFPILEEIRLEWKNAEGLDSLVDYYLRMTAREPVINVLGTLAEKMAVT